MILVTGANGLIGSALAKRLKSEGYSIWTPLRAGGIFESIDLNDIESAVLPSGLRTAFLCAWYGGVDDAAFDPQATYETNVEGNLKLVWKLKEAGVNVVFLSSSLVFSSCDISVDTPPSPSCIYGEHKASVEAKLDPRCDVIVRVTKVGETLLPRLSQWGLNLRSGGKVAAAGHLRIAPVMLDEVVSGLVDLARNFEPGIYQMSAEQDVSYLDLAKMIANKAGGVVFDDPEAGLQVFQTFPVSGRLHIASPSCSKNWPQGFNHAQRLVQTALS